MKKMSSVMEELKEVTSTIDKLYTSGVVDGFTEQPVT